MPARQSKSDRKHPARPLSKSAMKKTKGGDTKTTTTTKPKPQPYLTVTLNDTQVTSYQ